MFITFEGCEGSGKSTISRLVYAKILEENPRTILTREPGGTDIGNQIREILLNNFDNHNISPWAEVLLFNAARSQLVSEVIIPHLNNDYTVLCDRYTDSTIAYQLWGNNPHGVTQQMNVIRVTEMSTLGISPDITFFLDIKPEVSLSRKGDDINQFDMKSLEFHNRVYEGYQNIIRNDKTGRIVVVDATQPIEHVIENVLQVIRNRI